MCIFVLLLSYGYDSALQRIYGVPYTQHEVRDKLGKRYCNVVVEDYKLYDPRLLNQYAAVIGDRSKYMWVIMDALGYSARMPYVKTKLLNLAPRWATYPHPRVRVSLTDFLAAHGQPRHAPVIASLLYDQDQDVRFAAVDAMAHIVTPESLLALEVWQAKLPYYVSENIKKRVADHVVTMRTKLAEREGSMAFWPPFQEPPPQKWSPDMIPVEAPRRKPKN